MVSLRQLRYLESLAETRHFGHAAQACAVSQPALSMQIKELEDELKLSLVERRKSGIELTERGMEVARRARTILASVRDLVDYAKGQEGVLSGVLKLGAIPSIAPYLLPAALPALQQRFPALSLQLRETVTETLVRELVSGDLDVILIALPIEEPELETHHLFDDAFILATRATVENAHTRAATPDMLADDRLLLLEEGALPARSGAVLLPHDDARSPRELRRLKSRHNCADGGEWLRHHAFARDGDLERNPSRWGHSPVALRRARAQTGDRTGLAQDLAAQNRVRTVRRASARCPAGRGGADAKGADTK